MPVRDIKIPSLEHGQVQPTHQPSSLLFLLQTRPAHVQLGGIYRRRFPDMPDQSELA